MLELQTLTDSELTEGLKGLIKQERKIISLVLAHLEEVERRKLFVKRGYSSLFTYCTEELGYSAAAAQRRISSMRLSKQVPEIKEGLKSGALNLSTVAMADTFFRNEAKHGMTYEPQKKSEVLKELAGKTSRQVEQTLVSLSPRFVQTKERERPVSEELTEVRLTLTQAQMDKLKRLKELGISTGRISNAEILEWAMELALKKVDPLRRAERALRKKALNEKCSTSNHQEPRATDGNSLNKPVQLNPIANQSGVDIIQSGALTDQSCALPIDGPLRLKASKSQIMSYS